MPCAVISTRNLKIKHNLCPQSKEEGTDYAESTAVPQAAWQDLWYWHHKCCRSTKEETTNGWTVGVMEERALMLRETKSVVSTQSDGVPCDIFMHIHHYTVLLCDPFSPPHPFVPLSADSHPLPSLSFCFMSHNIPFSTFMSHTHTPSKWCNIYLSLD